MANKHNKSGGHTTTEGHVAPQTEAAAVDPAADPLGASSNSGDGGEPPMFPDDDAPVIVDTVDAILVALADKPTKADLERARTKVAELKGPYVAALDAVALAEAAADAAGNDLAKLAHAMKIKINVGTAEAPIILYPAQKVKSPLFHFRTERAQGREVY